MRKWIVIGIFLIIVGLSVGVASAEVNKGNSNRIPEIKHLFQPIDTEARKYLTDERSSEELNIFAKYLVKKYNRNLNFILDKLENTHGKSFSGKSLTQKEGEKFKYLIIREYLSRIDREQGPHKTYKEVVKLTPISVYRDSKYTYKVYYAPLSNSVPYPIYYWIQVYPDVYGGEGTDDAGNRYDVNGDNELYQVSAEYTTNHVKYTLYFRDEDHPNPTWDAIYDAWRKLPPPLGYGRIEDIESFTVQNGIINFDDIWDNDKTYAGWWGQHGDKTRNYTSNTKIFVSNVWNHAMDTLDKNPGMSKVWWYTSWSLIFINIFN